MYVFVGSEACVLLSISLLFYPKFQAVYGKKQEDSEEQSAFHKLSITYDLHLKEKPGKELLLLMDRLLVELHFRTRSKWFFVCVCVCVCCFCVFLNA